MMMGDLIRDMGEGGLEDSEKEKEYGNCPSFFSFKLSI